MILCWPHRRHHVVRHARRHIRRAFAPAAGYAKSTAFVCVVIGGPFAAVGGGWWLGHKLQSEEVRPTRGVDTLQGSERRRGRKSEASPNAVPEPTSLAVFVTAGALAFLLRRPL